MNCADSNTVRDAAQRVFTQHAALFKRLAIRDHHIYDNTIALGFAEREHVPELSDRSISELVYLHRDYKAGFRFEG